MSAKPLCCSPAWMSGTSCCLSPEKLRATNEAPERHRQQHRIDRRLEVGLAFLRLGADVGGGGELPLGQAVHAVVLDDVQHVEVAADGVAELAEADRQRIAVAGDADVVQLAVGRVGAHGDRGHAAVHRVEAVAAAHEVGGGLRRAADARELHQVLRLERQLPAGLDDGGGDGVVPAAGAQRRQRAFVVAAGEAERILRQRRMGDFGFGDEGHAHCSSPAVRGAPWRCAAAATSASTPSTMNAEEIGKPL